MTETPTLPLAAALSRTLGIPVTTEDAEQLELRLMAMCNNAFAKGMELEREVCAQVCENLDAWSEDDPGSSAAEAIRARSQA